MLEEICLNLEIAQKEKELNCGKGLRGYEKVGCYQCDGYNKLCEYYINKAGEENEYI